MTSPRTASSGGAGRYVGAQAERHGPDGPHVLRDALADEPVATRDGRARARRPRRRARWRRRRAWARARTGLDPLAERLAHPLVEAPHVASLCVESSESIGATCSMASNFSCGSTPTRWVGESGVRAPGTLLQLQRAAPRAGRTRRPRSRAAPPRSRDASAGGSPPGAASRPRGPPRGHVATSAARGRVGRGQGRGSEERLENGISIGDRSGTGNMEEIRAGGRWVCTLSPPPPGLSTRRRTATVKVSRPGCVPVSKSVR
jgi:hypothetical protein